MIKKGLPIKLSQNDKLIAVLKRN